MTALPRVLVTCPDFDPMTRYLSAWAKLYCNEALKRGHEVYTLNEKDVNRKKFEGMVAKNKPDIIFVNGHGNTDVVTGQDHEVILDSSSMNLIQNTIIYAVSCQSAKVLGKYAASNGATGYIGYEEDFILVSQPRLLRKPTSDTTAKLFLEPSNHVIASVTKGHTIQEAVEKGKAEYTKSIRAALNSDVQSDDDKYVPFLLWNRQWLVAHTS